MSDTFPDETLYPVLTSLADNDRIFASNSAAGHESSQIKGSTIKKTNTYTFHNGGEVTGVPWRIHGCNGTVVLTLPAGVPTGTEIGVFAGVTSVSTVTITRAGSDIIYTSSGAVSSFSVTGFGRYFTVVKMVSSAWIICGLEDSAIAAASAGKAPLASPALTGTPTAPTATAGTNTTQIATTAFCAAGINAAIAPLAPLASPALTGTPTAPTAAAGTNTTQLATTAFCATGINAAIAPLAPLASPALTGTPTAPTAAPGTNTTQLATTAFCAAALAGKATNWAYQFHSTGGVITGEQWKIHSFNASGTLTIPLASTVIAGTQIAGMVVAGGATVTITRSGSDQFLTPTGLATSYTLQGIGSSIVLVRVSASAWAAIGAPDSLINAAIAPLAPLASPALTGTPTARTAAVGTNSTQLATTAFCAAGFLPQFSAVVERTTNTTAAPGNLYVNVKDDSAENTLMLTLPSPTGKAGKVIGLTSRYRRSSYTNEEANWKLTGHIDGIASNTYWQGYWELGSALLWCDGTTWHMLTDWRAEQEW